MRKEKVILSPEHKEFQKMKRFIVKRFPGARTAMNSAGNYSVVYGEDADSVVPAELLYPPARTVREAWNQAKSVAWFVNMIRKSNNAFSDDKIFKKMAKERGNEE
jgi:hypothetical protein